MKISFERLNNLKDWSSGLLIFLLMVFPIIYAIIYTSFNSIQLTSKSFEEINILNSEIKKASSLNGEVFTDKENLIFKLNKALNPSIFSEYYFLQDYLIEAKFNGEKFEYYIKDIGNLIIQDETFKNLLKIKNVSYNSDSEFAQALRELMGIDDYKKYASFINSVIDGTALWKKIILYCFILIVVCLALVRIITGFILHKQKRKELSQELDANIVKAKQEITEKPEKITPVWDLANYTLQKYYNKNLSQVDSIYKLSIVVMIMGFLLIVAILVSSIFYNMNVKHETIGIIAGIITEFIGATFLFIYKSTISQALQHSKSLEDINNVGMAIKIIESISKNENNKEKLDDAKIEVAKQLILASKNGMNSL